VSFRKWADDTDQLSFPVSSLAALQKRLAYNFRDENFCASRSRIPSVAHESGVASEHKSGGVDFSGAVLQLVFTQKPLAKNFPHFDEGALTRRVPNSSIADAAETPSRSATAPSDLERGEREAADVSVRRVGRCI